MTHEQAQALLEALLDDELDVPTALEVEAHVDTCDHCANWLAGRRQLRARLREAALRYEAPELLIERLRKPVPRDAPTIRRPLAWPRAAAAGIVLVLGGFLAGRELQRPPDLTDELVGAHVRAVLSLHGIDVASSDHHTVKPWLSGQLPFSPPVPELASDGDALLGGRVDFVGRSRVAVLVYQHGHHAVNVFIWPTAMARGAVPSIATVEGYRVVRSEVGEFTAAIVSDMSAEELQAFQQRWRSAAGRG